MYTNTTKIGLPLALWLATDEYKYAKYANEISTTTFLRSPRYIIGSKRAMYPEEWEEHLRLPLVQAEDIDILSRVPARIGTAIHSSVEQAWLNNYKEGLLALGYEPDVIERVKINPETVESNDIPVFLEQRLYKEIEGFTISGQFDLVVDGNLHDIKTTSTYSWTSGINDEKYRLQGSIYRWLNPELITGDHLTINFVFSDWNKFKVGSEEGYPPAKIASKQYELMSLHETEMYVRNKLKILKKYWNEPLEIIPCCSEKELFSKPSVFKYYKTGYEEGKRATRNFATMADAIACRAKNKFQGDIVEHKPDPFMCQFCNPEEVMKLMQGKVKPQLTIE